MKKHLLNLDKEDVKSVGSFLVYLMIHFYVQGVKLKRRRLKAYGVSSRDDR
jgi:hypothetical protein